MARRRGRPRGTSGWAAVLSRLQIRHVFRTAKSRSRDPARAAAVLPLSVGLGLRAKELAGLRWADVTTRRGGTGKSCTSRPRTPRASWKIRASGTGC
jgi:integrase